MSSARREDKKGRKRSESRRKRLRRSERGREEGEKLKHPWVQRELGRIRRGRGERQRGGGRPSERERLPPFYSGADLHNDQRLSCLSKLFSAICIIFCRARIERTGGERDARRERLDTLALHSPVHFTCTTYETLTPLRINYSSKRRSR